MTLFDYLVLIIIACSVIISMMRGLVKEILSLAGWIAALVVANAYSDALSSMLPDVFPGQVTKLIVAFLILFIGTKLLAALISRALQEVVRAGGLTLADRGLGGLFGFARGCVIVITLVLLCGTTSIPKQPFWQNATFSGLAETAALTVAPYLPGEFTRHVHF